MNASQPTGDQETDLIQLGAILQHVTQREVAWLFNGASDSGKMNYSQQVREETLDRLQHATSGLTIIYGFALLEEFFRRRPADADPDDPQTPDYWKLYIEPNDLELLLAYRHIRHTIAHGFEGARADGHRKNFDRVYARTSGETIGVEVRPDGTLWLSHGEGHRFFVFLGRVATHALGRLANNNPVDGK